MMTVKATPEPVVAAPVVSFSEASAVWEASTPTDTILVVGVTVSSSEGLPTLTVGAGTDVAGGVLDVVVVEVEVVLVVDATLLVLDANRS